MGIAVGSVIKFGALFSNQGGGIKAYLESVFSSLWYTVDGTSMLEMFGGSPLTLSVDPGTTYIPADYAGTITAPSIDGWYLPSQDTLNAMYTNLHAEGLGDFIATSYWSSTEYNNTGAYFQTFSSGEQGFYAKNTELRVRPVRSFTASAGAYSIGDRGPANGWIFYIDGTTYYEAAPADLGAYTWSDVTDVEIGASAQGTAIGTGESNTIAIIAQQTTTSSAQQCADYSVGNADLIAADADSDTDGPVLYDAVGTPQALSVSDLIDTDLERVPVKYDDTSPHHIRMIGILDPDVYPSLTPADKRKISNYMDLWVFFWDNQWIDGGSVDKENRTF